ncbi:MAG: hypothetical protein HOW97_20755 [Catenulispora sp.]|nr:hypothetical protein [Catenulispora sp.]
MTEEQSDLAGFGSSGDERWQTSHSPGHVFSDMGSGGQTPAAGTAGPDGPIWPGDPRADTMKLDLSALRELDSDPAETAASERPEPDRPAWQLAAMQGREPSHADPMADTTLLRPVTLPLPAEEPVDLVTGLADLDVDVDVDADADVDEPTGSRSVSSLLLRQRRRLAVGAAGVAAVAALLALPPVRAQLRDSFTRLPQPYTALYFTSPPQVDGTVLTVPVSVHAVETGTRDYNVRVWTVDSAGHVDDSQNAGLKWDGQALSTVVSMPVNPAAEFVWVSLDGSDQTLHYKIAVA